MVFFYFIFSLLNHHYQLYIFHLWIFKKYILTSIVILVVHYIQLYTYFFIFVSYSSVSCLPFLISSQSFQLLHIILNLIFITVEKNWKRPLAQSEWTETDIVGYLNTFQCVLNATTDGSWKYASQKRF